MSSQWPPSLGIHLLVCRSAHLRDHRVGGNIVCWSNLVDKHDITWGLSFFFSGKTRRHLSDRVHEPIMNQSLEIPVLSAEANSKFRLSGWAHFNQHCLLTWVAWWLRHCNLLSVFTGRFTTKTCKNHEDHHSKCQNTAFVCFRDVRDPWKNPWHLLKIWGFCRCQAPLSTSHLEGHHGAMIQWKVVPNLWLDDTRWELTGTWCTCLFSSLFHFHMFFLFISISSAFHEVQ